MALGGGRVRGVNELAQCRKLGASRAVGREPRATRRRRRELPSPRAGGHAVRGQGASRAGAGQMSATAGVKSPDARCDGNGAFGAGGAVGR